MMRMHKGSGRLPENAKAEDVAADVCGGGRTLEEGRHFPPLRLLERTQIQTLYVEKTVLVFFSSNS